MRWIVLVGIMGCAAAPPTGWQQGGRPLVVPHARWINGDVLVDVAENGRVLVNGRHVLTVDGAGRVYDGANQPVALLAADGLVFGKDDEPLGWVGAGEAILPGEEESWLVFQPDGLVVRPDEDTNRPFGIWVGCAGAQTIVTCTLVTHLIGLELMERERADSDTGITPGLTFGIGVGVP